MLSLIIQLFIIIIKLFCFFIMFNIVHRSIEGAVGAQPRAMQLALCVGLFALSVAGFGLAGNDFVHHQIDFSTVCLMTVGSVATLAFLYLGFITARHIQHSSSTITKFAPLLSEGDSHPLLYLLSVSEAPISKKLRVSVKDRERSIAVFKKILENRIEVLNTADLDLEKIQSISFEVRRIKYLYFFMQECSEINTLMKTVVEKLLMQVQTYDPDALVKQVTSRYEKCAQAPDETDRSYLDRLHLVYIECEILLRRLESIKDLLPEDKKEAVLEAIKNCQSMIDNIPGAFERKGREFTTPVLRVK